MERNERPQRMLARMAELFDLPADIVAGLCHVEMLGDRQLFLEGHSGILSYGTEQIDVGAGSLILRVRGQNLTAAQHDRQRGAHLRQDRHRGICEMRELC